MTEALIAPFPYFGGKSKVADIVWQALGRPKHYIEPFFGSGAVLLARPDYDPTQHVETINDADGHLANVWRSLQRDPDAVARYCDCPVNHVDMSARVHWLRRNAADVKQSMNDDPEFFDPRAAGYWIYSTCIWIGTDMMAQPRQKGINKLTKIPHVADGGVGINKLTQIPHVSDGGVGINRLTKRPHVGDGGRGISDPYNTNIYAWFRALSERLRYVRIVCGDYSRVLGGSWQHKIKRPVGVFFDPPYAVDDRRGCYAHDSVNVAHHVREWAIERGELPDYRIVIAGYDEHTDLLEHGWTYNQYSTNGGYGNHGGASQGKINRHRECLYFSPHCLTGKTLFDGINGDPIMTTPQEEMK